ncbi:MAG: branched-chain amino acid ABC transporter permease [Dehalococcoidia bacterium]|nr:branched-chain amino acid ABC transporter permease [Dehalococcoidia bacterium]
MIEGIIVNTLVKGGVYALLAIGFSLIFGVARMLNLAHTAFYMLAAYALYTCSLLLGLNPVSAIVLALVVASLMSVGTYSLFVLLRVPSIVSIILSAVIAVLLVWFGTGFVLGMGADVSLTKAIILSAVFAMFITGGAYKLFIDRIREHHVTVLLVTLALAMVFQEYILLVPAFGGHYLGAPAFVSGYWHIIGVKVSFQHILTFVAVLLVLVGVWALLSKTRLGIAIRATAQDTEIANLMGIDVSRILLIVMGLASGLAAIAGVLVAPTLVLEPHMWMPPFIMMMAIIVLGGLGSIKGSFIGAFILALVEVLVVYLLPTGAFLKGAFALAVMVAVLVFRPEGLFGVVFEEERL